MSSKLSLTLTLPLLFLNLFPAFILVYSQSQIGVNYGLLGNNLPPPAETANLLRSTSIGKIRLYNSDQAIVQSLANTGIEIVLGIANGDIPALASNPAFSKTWVNNNVVPNIANSKIVLITIGNEVVTSPDTNLNSLLLPAMNNLQNALNAVNLGGRVKISTVHSMAVLRQSEPPSSGRFHPNLVDVIKGILSFNNATGGPFAINPYPYFAYQSDPRPETLAFCLFQPNAGRVDTNTNIKYMNMFAAQVDAVKSALNSLGFKNVEIVVAETGWPYKGDPDEVGPSVENAKAFNGNLIKHLQSNAGTPLMPGKSVDTYIFALYDENLKPGPESERSFGLFMPDLTTTYDIGLSKNGQNPVPTPNTTVSPVPSAPMALQPQQSGKSEWCVARAEVPDTQLQANLDYVCGLGFDCGPIQPGAACFEPNTLASHAAYAMNLYYHNTGRSSLNCDFTETGIITSVNPSYKGCVYPGST